MAEQTSGLKDRNTQAYYEAVIAMHATPGWAYFVEDLKVIYDAGNSLEGINTMEELNFRRGQIDIIKRIVSQPAVVSSAYDNLLAEEE